MLTLALAATLLFQDDADPVRLLGDLLRIQTYNAPPEFPGNETAVAEHVRALLEPLGLQCAIYEKAPGRGNLVAHLPATASDESRAILLMAHVDTVNVQAANWTTDPLAPEVRDGYLYGRGAIDDKGMAACLIAAVMRLARDPRPRTHDVILLLAADEEAGGDFGIDYLVAEHLNAIRANFALNEGGEIIQDDAGRVTNVNIQCAEKMMYNAILRARGTSGHSSVPNGDNPVEHIAAAIARIADYRDEPRLTDVTRGYFEGQRAQATDALTRHALDHLLDAGDPDSLNAAANLKPFYNAVLRNTATTTIVNAGIRFNVIPADATATVNVRLLPGETLDGFLAELSRAIANPQVEIVPEDPPEEREEPAPASPVGGDFYDALAAVAREMWPDAVVSPFMSTGATDSRALRAVGIPSYGLMPMPVTAEDKGRMHADNERVPVASLEIGTAYLQRVLERLVR